MAVIVLISILLLIAVFLRLMHWSKRELFANDSALSLYVINLGRCTDRYEHFMTYYAKSDLGEIQRIDAVDGKKLELQNLLTKTALDEILNAEKRQYRTQHYQLTRGAVGCYLSHLKTYQTFLTEGRTDIAVIFEDDAVVNPRSQILIRECMKSLPSDWDMALLKCTCRVCDPVNRDWNRVYRFFGLAAYLINKRSAKKILKLFKRTGKIYQQIDSQLSDYAEKDQLRIYSLQIPMIPINYTFKTTIQLPVRSVQGIDINGKPSGQMT